MSFRNISAWSIRNPVPPLVIFAALLLAGIVSFMRMEINNNPDVDFPLVSITVSQPGAAPAEMETQITQRVEAAVRAVAGVEEINSFAREGASFTNIQFAIGTPIDRALNDTRNAIDQIRGDLPDGILEPQVTRVDVTGDPIVDYSVAAPDMTLEQLSWYVDNTVARRLLAAGGVASVERTGGVSREVRVELDPARMQARGISAAQVNQQLRANNINATGGRAEVAGSEQSVRVLGNARNAFDLGQTQIAVGGGRTVKLADIATVRDGIAEQRTLATMNGKQVLSISVSKARGASEVTVYRDVKRVIAEIEKDTPGLKFTQLSTSYDYTWDQYTSALIAMVEGAVLAVIVVFIFLRDWRATLISAIAIPLSAIPAFWFMDMLGFTLNGLSLLALSLVAGILVDDAIVEIENIVRHMRMGKTAYQASIDAADEIGLAVLATTMAIVAVFLPVGLMPGISGQFFKNFGLTVVAAVLMSLAVARMITPLAAAYFLKAHGAQSHGEGWLSNAYMAALRWTLLHRWKTFAMGGVAFLLTIVAFMGLPGIIKPIPMQFQPSVDFDYSRININMVPGTTLEQTAEVANRIQSMITQAPEVQSAFARINVGSANIALTLRDDRARSSVEFERAWAPKLNQIADARINFQSQQGGGGPGGGRDIMIWLGGDDPVVLQQTANKLVEEMSGIPELRAPRTNADLQRPEILIRPRLDMAAEMGVTTAVLSQTIRIATIGEIDQNSARFSLSDRQVPIRVTLPKGARRDLSTIENLPVPTANGGFVPLNVVAEVSFGAGPTQIARTNQIRRVAVGVDLAPGLVTSDGMQKIEALPTMKNLPLGVQRLTLGDAKWQAELVFNFIIAVVSGVMLVFATLVLLYRRFLSPLVNMGSLLLAPLGGAIALRMFGMPISMPVYIGLLMLLGIVAKNSILLVDFAIEEMEKGVDKFTAIMDAGHKRMQPIVMTTVAMVAGMVPIALSLHGDGAWRQPMGVVVIGGLLMSTLLTLLIVPATFSLASGFETRLGPRFRRWFTNGGEQAGRPPAPQPAE